MATDVIIDGRRALKLLQDAVIDKGADWVDPNAASGFSCEYAELYQDKVMPVCIVGNALWRAGVDDKTLILISEYVGGILELQDHIDSWEDMGMDVPIVVTEDARYIFNAAQEKQDVGETWGKALEAALEEARELGVIDATED